MHIALQWKKNPEYLFWLLRIWHVLGKRNSVLVFRFDFNEKRGKIARMRGILK